MNTKQVSDFNLLYHAVYDENLREQVEDYNNTVFDEDIVEVATEYFYTYGLNEDGVNILIEKVGLDNFVEFVYDLSEDLTVLTEARSARKRKGGPSYEEVKSKIDAKEAAKKKAKAAAQERSETEKKEPESKGADTEAKEKQSNKKPVRDAIARRVFRAVDAYKQGMERHRIAMELARETGKTVAKAASVAHEAGRRAGEHVKKHGLKSLANEEIENYFDEAAKRTRKKVRGAKDPEKEMAGRSDAGKRISGDEKTGPRHYTLGRKVSPDAPTQPGKKPEGTPKLASWERDDIEYRKANLKAGKTHKVGGEKGLPESYDNFDYILEYLVAEGYADTNQAALAIMANMSEEWRQSIVEGIFDFLPKSTTVVPGKYGKNTVLAKKGGVEGVADKSKPGSFTPQKGGWDSMDANRYADERIKQGHSTGGVNVANRRVTPNRVK